MANETGLDSSGMSGSVPSLLREKCLQNRYAKSKVWKYCLNGVEGDPFVKGAISKFGDRVVFQIMPDLTVQDISTTDGSITQQEIVLTQATITINKWKGVKIQVVDIVEAQSVVRWEDELAKAFGEAISEQQDIDVLSLVASLSNGIGDTGPMTDGKVLQGQRSLDDLKIPIEDRAWALGTAAESDLLAVDKFTIASATGYAKGLQVEGGRLKALYGTPAVVTPLVTTTSSQLDNVLFHKEAFGVVMQKDFKITNFGKVQFSTERGADALYGVATTRGDHAIRVRSGAAAA